MADAKITVRFAGSGDTSPGDKAWPKPMQLEPMQDEDEPGPQAAAPPKSPGPKKSPHGVYKQGDDAEDTPLTIHEAAEQGLHKDIARMVERTLDFDINQRDRYGRTALMWAAEMDHQETAETLVDLGADRRATDPQTNRTALHLAARSGALSVLHVLLEDLEPSERTEYVNEADRNGITPVFLAKQRGDEALPAFEYLMECGARYNQQAWAELSALPPLPPVPQRS